MSHLKAPNGKPSNLTPQQWKLVRTPQFKAWFGDWENDPENASKVVDENGEPLVVYHGTNSDFNVFQEGKIGLTDKGWYGYGYYFSPSTEMSDLYGNSKPYFLKIKKIFNTNKENPFYLGGREVTENYIDKGYDGSSKTFDVNKMFHEYCVFFQFPNNIKLADGSNTTFDGNNPDIRFAEGGITTSKLKAPNGKPSNLNAEQWKLVRTPQFKAWFGDWENDPENASKVVDENGEPLVVYHGTYVENPFYIFDFNKADLGFHFGTYEQAKNRSETKLFFKNRKSVVNSFFLNIQNIYEMSDIGEWEYPPRYIDMLVSDGLISESDAKKNGFYRLFQREDNIQIREYLLAKYGKFIGFIYNNKYEGVGKSFIVLNPEQIKLADGSNTTFDGKNPDIRFAEGGTTNYGVDELYDIATRTFIGLGYDVTQGSNSKTDYGHSRYFYVNQDNKADVNSGLGFQVRVSDHSTGDRRILNGEQFIFDNKDVMVVFNRINYWFHPEEYNNVVAVKTKVVQIEVGENDLQPSDEIISERVAKSGSKRYTIKRTYKNEGVVPTHKFSGYKLPFKPNNPDIRFAEGGSLPNSLHIVIENVNPEKKYFGQYKKIFDVIEEDITLYNPYGTEDEKIIGNDFHIWISPIPDNDKVEQIKKLKGVKVLSNYYAEGGKTKKYMKRIKRGGITYGKSHAEGGIPVKNQSTGDMLEVEGGEGIVNKRSMASDKRVKLNGKDMTICEAVSQLNQMEGGVKFSCDDVEDRQFIEAMAKGGELERGTRTEQEHIQVLKDLYAKRITPKEASKRIAKDHLKEDAHYYSKLAKMEGKMANGGTFNVKYDVTKKPDENNFYYIIYTESGKKVPSSNLPTDIGYGKLKNEFEAKRRKYDNSLGLKDAIFIAMKMNEADMKMAKGGRIGREETQENNFGVSYKLGDKFILNDVMSSKQGIETSITQILSSGLFFKVDKSSNTFSIKTLHSKGSSLTRGQYLIPLAKMEGKMAKGGITSNKVVPMGTITYTENNPKIISRIEHLQFAMDNKDHPYYSKNQDLVQKEFDQILSRLPFTTWYLELDKGQTKFEFLGNVYELVKYTPKIGRFVDTKWGINKIQNNNPESDLTQYGVTYQNGSWFADSKQSQIDSINYAFYNQIYGDWNGKTFPNQNIQSQEKMAEGGKIQSLSEFGNEFEKAKKELYSSNDAYQKSVEEGVAIKNDSLLSDQEKEKLLEIARKTARANKEILESARKGLTDLRTDSSPFYAPQLAKGGMTAKERINKGEGGHYKFSVKHSYLPSKGIDVFLHIDSQSMLGSLKFSIGTRNLYGANWKAIVDDVLTKHLKIIPSNYQLNVGKKAKSIEVEILFNTIMTSESYIAVSEDVLKALTNRDYYQRIVNGKKEDATPTPPTEKKGDWNWRFKTEDELKAELGGDLHAIKDGSIFVKAMRYLLGKEISKNVISEKALDKINRNTYGGVKFDTEKVFGIPNPEYDNEWYIASWMITNKPKEISHIDTEVEITRWSEQKVREKNDNPAMTFKVSNLVGYILLNLGNARMSDFTQLIAYAKESEMLSKEIAKLEQQGLDINGFVIKLMTDKVLNSIENLKAQIMLFTNKEEDIKEQLNTIVFFIPYLAELDTFDKDYIIHIK